MCVEENLHVCQIGTLVKTRFRLGFMHFTVLLIVESEFITSLCVGVDPPGVRDPLLPLAHPFTLLAKLGCDPSYTATVCYRIALGSSHAWPRACEPSSVSMCLN